MILNKYNNSHSEYTSDKNKITDHEELLKYLYAVSKLKNENKKASSSIHSINISKAINNQ